MYNLKEVIEVSQKAVEPVPVNPGTVLFDPRTSQFHDTERFLPAPNRTRGLVNVYDVDSFVQYWNQFAEKDVSQIYADFKEESPYVLGVINHPSSEDEAWGDHRIKLNFRQTPEWVSWVKNDRRAMGQVEFAEFVEDNLRDISTPPAADMLEIVKNFQAKSDVSFRSAVRLDNGEVKFETNEAITAKAGVRDLIIPSEFVLGIRPFDTSEAYAVKCRFRYRIRDGALTLSYAMDRRADIVKDVVFGVITNIENATSINVMIGMPA